jgi:CheY-like chemotaxis protein
MPKTLLLADDSVVIQKLVGLSFANEDVKLVTTDNGDEALKRARALRPDLVLADVVMPGKNGYEVCEAIKTDPELRHIPVLLLTGTFEAFDEERARRVGSNGHITKPFEAQGLVDRVTDLLSHTPPPPAAAPVRPTKAAEPQAARPAPPRRPPAEEAYDFFDDDLDQDLRAPRRAAPPATPAASPDDAFEFGTDLDALSPPDADPDDPDTLDTSFEIDSDSSEDLRVQAPPAPVRSPAAPGRPAAPLSPDLGAPDATRIALGETTVADDFATPSRARASSLDERLGGRRARVDLEAPTLPPRPPADPPTKVLSNDLFDAAPTAVKAKPTAAVPPPIPKPARQRPAPLTDSAFAFGVEEERPARARLSAAKTAVPESLDTTDEMDPLAGMSADPPQVPIPAFGRSPASAYARETEDPALVDAADSTHSGYDVSASDLGDPLGPAEAIPAAPAARARARAPEPTSSDIGLTPATGPRRSDLSPMMRERIHETLEKIAWEAFADVSDSIVRQVLQRVESIVWEVVPQMAEALIQEEIRKMKGED